MRYTLPLAPSRPRYMFCFETIKFSINLSNYFEVKMKKIVYSQSDDVVFTGGGLDVVDLGLGIVTLGEVGLDNCASR